MPSRPRRNSPSEGYSVREVLGRAHRQGPTSRWARFYRHHWQRLRELSARRWDRPPEPHDWRWLIGLLGRVLVTAGLLMLGFVGYQLWGTGLSTAAAQASLEEQFAASLQPATPQVITTTTNAIASDISTTTTDEQQTSTTVAPAVATPTFVPGEVVAQLQIPSIDVDFFVVSGVGVEDLRLGPGHFTDTPLPGQLGNSAIAGHRTTYGQPFHDLDQLSAGDDIIIATAYGTFTYEVNTLRVVEPTEYSVVSTTDPTTATLTLTTCHPKWSAAQRLIVTATLDDLRSDPLLPDVATGTTAATDTSATTRPSTSLPTSTLPSETSLGTSTTVETTIAATLADPADLDSSAANNSQGEEVFSAGWFHDSTALVQAIIWMVILLGIRTIVIRVSQRRKSWWPMLPVGLLPAAIGLYFFYLNINNLVPPNL
ncbi:MAG: class E sortase [Ilumatobacteraceae bacterium]